MVGAVSYKYEAVFTVILDADGLDSANRRQRELRELLAEQDGVANVDGPLYPKHRNDLDGALKT